MNIAHVSNAVVKSMIKSGALLSADAREIKDDRFLYKYFDTGSVKLNDEQQSAANTIAKALSDDEFSVHLLDGITGSGKTQVYFDSVLRAYNAGKSVLLMMPEIPARQF